MNEECRENVWLPVLQLQTKQPTELIWSWQGHCSFAKIKKKIIYQKQKKKNLQQTSADSVVYDKVWKGVRKKSQNWIFKADRYTYKSRLHWVSHRNIPIYIIPGSQAVVSCIVYGHGINGVHGILQEMREELVDIHFHAITDCSENEIKKSYFINIYSSYLN